MQYILYYSRLAGPVLAGQTGRTCTGRVWCPLACPGPGPGPGPDLSSGPGPCPGSGPVPSHDPGPCPDPGTSSVVQSRSWQLFCSSPGPRSGPSSGPSPGPEHGLSPCPCPCPCPCSSHFPGLYISNSPDPGLERISK